MADPKEAALQERIASAVEKINKAKRDTKKISQEIRNLDREVLVELSKRQDLEKDVQAQIQQQLANLRQSVDYYKELVKDSQEYFDNVKGLANTAETVSLKYEAQRRLLQDQIALNKKKLETGKEISATTQSELAAYQEQLNALTRKQSRLEQMQGTLKRTNLVNSKFVQGTLKIYEAWAGDTGSVTQGLNYTTAILTGPLLRGFRSVFGTMFREIKKLFFEVDNVTNAFERQTNMGDRFTDGMISSYESVRGLGIGMEDLSKQTVSLINNVTDFTMVSAVAAERVRDTGAMLERVGVQADDFSKGIQNSMKFFGQSIMGAEHTARQLLTTANELGVTPQQMAADYARVGGSLAKLGKEGPKAFQELARVSKITGMEIEKLVSLTSKFDTFEDAATMTGQLNAALGGNFVNAMDMMMTTDPVQRFEQLRNAISSTGLTFDDMSYYQRQFFANAMGLSDVGDLALMMSGNMDMMAGATQQSAADYEELARQADATNSIQEKFNAVMAQLAPVLVELMDDFHALFDEIRNNEELIANLRRTFEILSTVFQVGIHILANYPGTILIVAGAILLLGTIFTVLTLLKIKNTAATLASIQADIAKIASSEALNAAMVKQGTVMKVQGKSAGAGAVGLMKFALAVLAIGAGIGIAAAGIGYMAHGFAELFESIDTEKFGLISRTVTELTVNIPGAVLAFGSLSTAMAGFGLSLRLVPSNQLGSIAKFAEAMSTLETDELSKVADMLKEIASAMKAIPENKAIELTQTLKAVTSAAKTMETVTYSKLIVEEIKVDKMSNGGGGGTFGNAGPGADLGTITLEVDSDAFENTGINLSLDSLGNLVCSQASGR